MGTFWWALQREKLEKNYFRTPFIPILYPPPLRSGEDVLLTTIIMLSFKRELLSLELIMNGKNVRFIRKSDSIT
jgi:hypothetical protein